MFKARSNSPESTEACPRNGRDRDRGSRFRLALPNIHFATKIIAPAVRRETMPFLFVL